MANLARFLRVLTAPFVRYVVVGGEVIPHHTHAVVVANHHSMFDWFGGLVCIHRFRRYPRLLINAKYLQARRSSFLLRAAGTIPVGGVEAGANALVHAEEALRGDVPILMMPEGRLHWNPERPAETGPGHTGAARVASATGSPILVVALAGTEDVWPPKRYLPRLNPFRRKVVACYAAHDVLYLAGDDHRADTDLIMKEIGSLLEDAYEIRAACSGRGGRRRARELNQGVRDRTRRGARG